MAADILLYDAHQVPVGKDQLQHLEITRDIAETFNRKMGDVLVVPEATVNKQTMYVPGTDGQKMSKSYGNFINIFLPEKELKDVINKKIITDATALEDPKDAENSVVYQLYKLIMPESESLEMKRKLEAGGYGWGHAKKDLLQGVLEQFSSQRDVYNRFMNDTPELDNQLRIGSDKARGVASATLGRVRSVLGY
jgi:tryptophanyl-tRNA synthetase